MLEVHAVIHRALSKLPNEPPYTARDRRAPKRARPNRRTGRSCCLFGLGLVVAGGFILLGAIFIASFVTTALAPPLLAVPLVGAPESVASSTRNEADETLLPTATIRSDASTGIWALPMPIAPPPTGRVTAQELNVRLFPNPTSPSFGHFREGTLVSILEDVTPPAGGRWMRVRENDASGQPVLEGWVNARYVSVDPGE